MLKPFVSGLAILVVAGATVIAGDVNLEGVQCVVAPRSAQLSKSAKYKEGKVYFCCGGCQGKFAKDQKKYTTKANHQLVSTKQYEQKACPLSGGEVNPETKTKVAGTEVAFCCNGCKGKVEAAEEAEQLKLVFNNKAFDKSFKKVAKKSSVN
ncbi:MAG: hypothetical protein AAF989_11170 [Planctomycetota bacterium]